MSFNRFNRIIHAQVRRVSAGFTLIEVLLGIMILALGLLGLAAVFPLVVKQQRTSQDAVVGLTAAKGAEAVLKSHFGLLDPSTKGGWAALSRQLYNSAYSNSDGRVKWSDVLGTSSNFAMYGTTADQYGKLPGTLRIASDKGVASDVYIKTTDRLLPSGQSGVDPLFVWDMVTTLVNPVENSTGKLTDQSYLPLRATVFIRRLDPGIRVPAGKTLLQTIADSGAVPVAADNDKLATLDGKGSYSGFLYPQADPQVFRRFGVSGGPYNVLTFSKASNSELAAIRQIGQQLVDTDGNIYTVTAFPDETGPEILYASNLSKAIVITPGLPNEVVNSGGSVGSNYELLCTPQIPAAVTTFLVRP